jgi:hypothetical protein
MGTIAIGSTYNVNTLRLSRTKVNSKPVSCLTVRVHTNRLGYQSKCALEFSLDSVMSFTLTCPVSVPLKKAAFRGVKLHTVDSEYDLIIISYLRNWL